MKELFRLNIQLFGDAPDGAGSGGPAGAEPTPQAGAPTGTEGATGTATQIEIPEYINSYVEGVQDAGQKEYLQGLLGDEKAVNLLKGIIPNPNAEWTIKADDYKDMTDDVNAFITAAKEQGMSETTVKYQLEARRNYLASEKSKMTPEQIALEPIINNFIGAEKDVEVQNVYARLAENAAGRKVLQKLMELTNPGTTSVSGGYAAGGVTYDHQTFIDAYNEAKPVGGKEDKNKLRLLEQFAKNNSDPYFRDFLGIK